MDTRKWADSRLQGLKLPVIERLIRAAPPAQKRAFAVACARLAGSITDLRSDEKLRPLLERSFDAAALLVEGVDPYDPRVVQAREAAEVLEQELDEVQLQFHGRVMQDTEEGRCSWDEHPLRLAYSEASVRWSAVAMVAMMLHEDPLEATADNLDRLKSSLGIDYDTLLAVARHWLLSHLEPIERDDVWPVFRSFPEE